MATCLQHGTVCNDVLVAGLNLEREREGVADEMPSEGGLGNDVKNGVKDRFSVGRDGGSAFSKNPHDGVEEPSDNNEVASLVEDVPVHMGELGRGRAQLAKDGDEAKDGETEESPFLAAADKRANKTGNDHEEVKEVDEVAVGEPHPGNVKDFPKEKGGGEGPVDVAGVVEGAAVTAADGVAVAEGHGEVGHGGDETDDASNHAVVFVESGGGQGNSVAEVFGEEIPLCLGEHRCRDSPGLCGGAGAEEEEQSGEEEEGKSNPKCHGGGELLSAAVHGAWRAAGTRQAAVAFFVLAVGLFGSSIGGSAVLSRYELMLGQASTHGALARGFLGAATEADLVGFEHWGSVGFSTVRLAVRLFLTTVGFGLVLCTLGLSTLGGIIAVLGEGKRKEGSTDLHSEPFAYDRTSA